MRIDGESQKGTARFFAVAANIPFWDGRDCLPWAPPGGGRIGYALLPEGSRLFRLAVWDKFRQGRCGEIEAAGCGLCDKLDWAFSEPARLRADGRRLTARRVSIEAAPRQIRMILPGLSGQDCDEKKEAALPLRTVQSALETSHENGR